MSNLSDWKRVPLAVFAILAVATFTIADTTNSTPPPGTLNYVEGQVSIEGQEQTPKSVGTTYLEPNQVLDTRNGNAEVLLTPGVYLRVGHDSEVRMISPELANTAVELTAGSAMVEVDQLFKENDLSVLVANARTTIESKGLYGFEANPASASVMDGKAVVTEGDNRITLKKGHEALLDTQRLRAQGLPKEAVENDALYRWSKLRSEYASESNVNVGNALIAEGGWLGPGWYWDPFWTDFAFVPGYGMFWGPFGWPFFSPAWAGYAPYYGVYGYVNYYRYPARGKSALRSDPPLARHAAPGSGFGRAPRPMAAPRSGMDMRMGPPMARHVDMGPGPARGGFGHVR